MLQAFTAHTSDEDDGEDEANGGAAGESDDDEWDPSGTSACKVVGQCAERYQYANGRAAPSHVIEHQGTLFPVKTSALKDFAARQARRAGKSSAK